MEGFDHTLKSKWKAYSDMNYLGTKPIIKNAGNGFVASYVDGAKMSLFLEGDLDDSSMEEDKMLAEELGMENENFQESYKGKIALYIDLENEEILDVEKVIASSVEGHIAEGVQPLLFPQHPLFPLNYSLYFFPDQPVQQILSNDILINAIQLFNLSKNGTLKLGWNSKDACNSLNHMHFQLMYGDVALEETDVGSTGMLPMEMIDKIPFYETDLKHNISEEIELVCTLPVLSRNSNDGVN